MKIVSLKEIKKVLDIKKSIDVVKRGFMDYSKGLIDFPNPMQILFLDDNDKLKGDCHVKSAKGRGEKYFVIKIASGFYGNLDIGKDVNSGIVVVLSALTGEVVALLNDNGYLTTHRTAAAGALAASLKTTTPKDTLGIVGTGSQAKMQAIYITKYLGLKSVLVYGRSFEKAKKLCKKLEKHNIKAKTCKSIKKLCHNSSIVVTTTPSQSPILEFKDLPKSLHIVAVGADSPGKIELESKILSKANLIVTDDHVQCLSHGEYGHFVKKYSVKKHNDIPLGYMLEKNKKIEKNGISIVDLTGIGAQDLAIATYVLDKI